MIEALGFNLTWFAILVAVNLQTAWLSPPVALSAYFLKGVVPEWDLKDIYYGMMQFMVLQVIGLVLIIIFPKIAGDAAFVGDTLFMPDFGTARCDFPGGSSENLFASIQKILTLPDATRIFVGHDYKAPGREHYAWETTVGEQKKKNIHIKSGKSKEDFVKLRDERDAKLAMPKLIVPSLQINMRAGNMPEPDEQGDVFLKVPINKM